MQQDRISYYRRSSLSSIDSCAAWSMDEDYQLALLVLHFIPMNLAWVFFNTRSNLSYASYTKRYNLMETIRCSLIARRAPPSGTHELLPSFNRVAKQMQLAQFDLFTKDWKGANLPPIVSNLTQLLHQSSKVIQSDLIKEQSQSPPKVLPNPMGQVKTDFEQESSQQPSDIDMTAKLDCFHSQIFSEQDNAQEEILIVKKVEESSIVKMPANDEALIADKPVHILTDDDDDDLMNRINQLAELDSSKSQLDVSFEVSKPNSGEIIGQEQNMVQSELSSSRCIQNDNEEVPVDVSIDKIPRTKHTDGRIRTTFKRMATYTRRRHKNQEHVSPSRDENGQEKDEQEDIDDRDEEYGPNYRIANRPSGYTNLISGGPRSWRRGCSRVSSLGNMRSSSSMSSGGFWSIRGHLSIPRSSTMRGLEA